MIPSFCPVSCSRCGRSFIAPGPRGHICPQCQKERRMNREKRLPAESRRPPGQRMPGIGRTWRRVPPDPWNRCVCRCSLWNHAGRICWTRGSWPPARACI